MALLDPEVPRQPAAPAEERRVGSRAGEQLAIGGGAEHRRLVAVRLHGRTHPAQIRQFGADGEEELRERLHARSDPRGGLPAEELLRVVFQRGQTRRFDPDDGDIARRVEGRDGLPEIPPRDIELTGGDERQTAAHRLLDDPDRDAGVLEDRDGRTEDPRGEVVRPRVREEDDLAEAVRTGRSARTGSRGSARTRSARPRLGEGGPPRPERRRREHGNRPPGVDAGQLLAHRADPGQPHHPVDQGRERSHGPRQLREEPERVVRARPQPSPVGLVEDLGLVRRHVRAGRAFAAARLARQAQVERLGDGGGVPGGGEQIAGDHLLEHPRPTPRRMLLIPCGLERRAHGSAGRRGIRAAFAHPGAPVDG